MLLSSSNTTYRIYDSVLGKGGQGTVVLGVDTCNSKCVAVKYVDLIKEEQIRAFSREREIIEKISDVPYVCETFNVEQVYETGYIIMKQYPFDLFTRVLEHEVKLNEIEIKKIFRKVCLGVKGMHDRSIAHLDIKPENILLDYSDNPFICDFGSSQLFEGIKRSNSPKGSKVLVRGLGKKGTTMYCSPESLRSPQEYDPFKSDIFSLGVTLHVILTGHYPYGNEFGNIPTLEMSFIPSQACYELLEAMLEVNVSKRLNINKVLLHPWFKNNSPPNIKKTKVIKYIDKVSKCYTPMLKSKLDSL